MVNQDDDDPSKSGAFPRITVIPAGVHVDRIEPLPTAADPPHVVIVGPLSWAPNTDAALWFLADIWPRITRAVPDARCTVAGSHPPARLRRLAGGRIAVPGFVEKYERLLASATVMAVPLRVGGGMRVKLLEFFAYAKAVVSTPVGAEGNEAQDGSELLLAGDAEAFADAVVRLLKNPDLAAEMGLRARALAERRYAWSGIAAAFERAYHDAITIRHQRRLDPASDSGDPASDSSDPASDSSDLASDSSDPASDSSDPASDSSDPASRPDDTRSDPDDARSGSGSGREGRNDIHPPEQSDPSP